MADNSNQSDEQIRYGRKTVGIVVDIGYGEKDPKKQDGRVQIRLAEQVGSSVPDDKLQWVSVKQSPSSPQLRGVGTFPGHSLLVGSKVELEYDSQQKLVITGVLKNDETDESKTDVHPMSRSTSNVKVITDKGLEMLRRFAGKMPYEFKGTRDAESFVNQLFKTNFVKGDIIGAISKFVSIPQYQGGGKGLKSLLDPKTPLTLANFPHNAASVLNATKAAEQLLGQKGELIPNAFKMIEELKKVAQQGLNIDAIKAVGGIQNIAGAIAGIAQIAKTASAGGANQQQQDQFDLEEELRRLYRLETGQDPLDEQGKETLAYIEWKITYLETRGLSL